jgi:ABC-type amino acid transport substrate-binding protein
MSDHALRNAVAKVLGVTWNVQNGTFATIIPGVQNGKYQVGQDNFGATKAREQVVDFATYLNDGQAFLGASTVLIANGDYAKVFAKWGVGGDLITKSVLNPATTF